MKLATGIWLALSIFSFAGALEFVETSKEINAPVDVTTVVAEYEFTNKTQKPVTIIKSDPGCSCVAVQISEGKLRYGPGEKGTIRATFDMGNFTGSVDKVIALWLDNDPIDKPSTMLNLKVNIPVLIGLEPKTLKWDLDGKPEPQTIQIKMAEGQTIRVTGVKSSSDSFVCQLKTVQEGRQYELVVTPTDLEKPGIGVFRIETDCTVAKQKTQQAFGVVRRPTPAENAAQP